MRHVLLTRFNVDHIELRGTFRGLDPGWLEHRISYFERRCVPSVAAQTSKTFDWLVFVHPDTPESFRTQVERATQDAGGRVVWSQSGDTAAVVEALSPVARDDVLVTSRVDCDDALARDYIERTALSIPVALPAVINLRTGAKLSDDGVVRRTVHSASPFLSYAERTDAPATCWGFVHNRPPGGSTIVQVGGAPAWLASIHDHNVANGLVTKMRLRRSTVLSLFELHPEDVAVTPWWAMLSDNTGVAIRAVGRGLINLPIHARRISLHLAHRLGLRTPRERTGRVPDRRSSR